MSRPLLRCLLALLALASLAAPVGAQEWNAAPVMDLVRRAVERRQAQLADTALRDYHASAHGYLTFLGQFGEGFPDPPVVVKSDELALSVYWRAPDLSKQVIVGRRDTLLLPGDIGYYRDRFGIVQNNFPDRIRLGEGNDVSDVPHPLSPIGLQDYDFAAGDSVRIRLGQRSIHVYQVRVRPKDANQPRVVGSVYISSDDYAVVRMTLTFTRAAILDKRIETLAVTLENALVSGRFWLPRRQQLEVVRTGTWLDYPARGIIRARWEVGDYAVNQGIPITMFAGPEIVTAPPQELARYRWQGRIVDSLPPDVRALTPAEVEQARAQAEALVEAHALARAGGAAAVSARGLSDVVRVNRVEGLALGAGTRLRPTEWATLSARGRYGVDDRRAKARVALDLARPTGGPALALFAERSYRDVGDVQETSLARNTIAAQEFGSDWTDPYDVRGAGAALSVGGPFDVRLRLEGAYEAERRLFVHAEPLAGHYEPTEPAWPLVMRRTSLFLDHAPIPAFGGTVRWSAELRAGHFGGLDTALAGRAHDVGRLFTQIDVERPFGDDRLVTRTTAAGAVGDVPPQQLALLGGPVSGPGFAFHQFAGRVAASQHVEWQFPVPFPSLPLARYGRAPARATLAPYGHLDLVRRPGAGRSDEGLFPSVGVGGLFLFDLLRIDVARGVRDGRWLGSVDVTRVFWGVL